MDDVMKKRLIGVAVLVVIGVVTPLLLSQCLHGDDADDGSMRVYNVTPSGSTQSSSNATKAGGKSEETNQSSDQDNARDDDQAKKEGSSQPDAVSPQDKSSKDDDERFSTPPVSGDGESKDSDSRHNSKQSSRGSPSAEPENSGDSADDNDAAASSSQASKRSQSSAKAQRNDSASGWVVQVAASTKLSNAQALVQQLSADYRASYAKVKVDGKTWYRVNVGPFADEDAARSSAASLKNQGRKPLVRHLP